MGRLLSQTARIAEAAKVVDLDLLEQLMKEREATFKEIKMLDEQIATGGPEDKEWESQLTHIRKLDESVQEYLRNYLGRVIEERDHTTELKKDLLSQEVSGVKGQRLDSRG
ncbi:MAG TPA: hypothetical protein VEF04_11870 [Blastocatellia bacterium]|nr:hypothetical protein [Blastocatellia bacterium]